MRHTEQVTQPLIEARSSLTIGKWQQQRAAGVAGVGNKLAAGQLEHQPAFNRSQRKRTRLRGSGHSGFVVDQPAHLGPGKIGIEQQSGSPLDLRFMSIFAQ